MRELEIVHTALSAPCELEVRYLWRGDRPHQLQPVQIVAEVVEKPLTAPEKRRHEANLHFVHQASREILLCGSRSAAERYILAAGGSARLFERSLNAVCDEGEGRSAFKREWRARVMREHEHGVVERRGGAPPTTPRVLGVPRAPRA